MEKLMEKINDIQKQIDDLYDYVVSLQVQNVKLLGKLKELESFWYEE